MILDEILKTDSTLKILSSEDKSLRVDKISLVEEFANHSVCFVKNNKFLQKLSQKIQNESFKALVIIDEKLWDSISDDQKQLIKTKITNIYSSTNVALSLTLISKPFYMEKTQNLNFHVDGRQMGTASIHPSAFIAQGVFIGENVIIGEHVSIASGCVILPNVEIGNQTILYPNVTLYPWTKIGQKVRLHSGVVIGADGFGYTFHQGEHLKIWHTGGVIIEDQVEIGANSTVDMGTFSPTFIGFGTKIDNAVQVGHNVKIGKHCVLCGQAGVSGSAVLEDYVIMAGKAGVGPDAHLGKGTILAGAALVNESATWPAGSKLGGHPARDLKEWMKGFAYLRKVSLSKD